MRLGYGLVSLWHLTRLENRLPVAGLCTMQALMGLRATNQMHVESQNVKGAWTACNGRGFVGVSGLGGVPFKKKHAERKMLGYSPQQIFTVVSQVEHYSEFVPWCVSSTVRKRQENYTEAELQVGFQLFVERYISKVYVDPPHYVRTLTDESTLFQHLTSEWKFEPGPTPMTCLLHFSVDFAFKSPLYQQVASVFYEEVTKKMLGAFEDRLEIVYGPSSMLRGPKAVKAVA